MKTASHVTYHNLFKFDRYTKSTISNKTTLIELWSEKYKIAKENMLLLHLNTYNSKDSVLQHLSLFEILHDKSLPTFPDNPTRHIHFILVADKTKLVYVSKDGDIQSISKSCSISSEIVANKYGLVLLYYFDIENQKIPFCKSLLVEMPLSIDKVRVCIQNNIDLMMENIDNGIKQEFKDSMMELSSTRSVDAIIQIKRFPNFPVYKQRRRPTRNTRRDVGVYIRTHGVYTFALSGKKYARSCRDYDDVYLPTRLLFLIH